MPPPAARTAHRACRRTPRHPRGRALSATLIALLSLTAHAAPRPSLHIEATVSPDLRCIEGTLHHTGLEDADWVDPLATQPEPDNDLSLVRTYPARRSRGEITWSFGDDPSVLQFRTCLPKRWGAVGWTRHHLAAAGAWYPQPLTPSATEPLPQVDFEVTVQLPEGTRGTLGDVAGAGRLTWRGSGERAMLAVIRGGQLTALDAPGLDLTLLTRGPPRRALTKNLQAQLPFVSVHGAPQRATVAELPLRRRMTASGPGSAFLSDRTWKVLSPLARLHHVPALTAVTAAATPQPDPFARGLAAAALADRHAHRLTQQRRGRFLRLVRWIPLVDAALYDPQMAFQDEIFRRAHPIDPGDDPLGAPLTKTRPAAAAVGALADRSDREATWSFAEHLVYGWPVEDAARRAGLDPAWIDRSPAPVQDYRVQLDGRDLTITREAAADAPEEPVVLLIDGERRTWIAGPGPDALTETLPHTPKRVALDPEGHLSQTDRTGDVRPARLRFTARGQISQFNLTQGFIRGFVATSLRRADDTRNRAVFRLSTSQRDILRGAVEFQHFFGPLIRGTIRQHVLAITAVGAGLNANFADNPARSVVGGMVRWGWSNQFTSLFPLRGARVSASAAVGGFPDTGGWYASAGATTSGVVPLGVRQALAARLTGGFARSDLNIRRMEFGGDFGVRGIADLLLQTDEQAILSVEYRAVPIRAADIDLGLLRADDLHLVLGADLGVGNDAGQRVMALGGVVGLGGVVEWLGVSPATVLITTGVPLWTSGFTLPADRFPVELYLGWGMSF